MNDSVSKSILKKLSKDIQTMLTIAYLVAVAIGMLFNYKKFILFDINIFDFAGLFDFIIAPFGDFAIALFTIGTIVLTVLVYQLDRFWQKKHLASYAKFTFHANEAKGYTNQKWSMVFLLFILYLFLGADTYAKRYKRTITDENPITVTYSDNTQIQGVLIGKTTDYVFLLQGVEVKAIPMNALIKEIKLK